MASSSRVAYSPGEFAKMFGKSQTWGYRQIYAGKVNAITEHGRLLIPAKEVERILESAGIYNGRETTPGKSQKRKQLNTEQQEIWKRFIELRRSGGPMGADATTTSSKRGAGTQSVDIRARLLRSWGG